VLSLLTTINDTGQIGGGEEGAGNPSWEVIILNNPTKGGGKLINTITSIFDKRKSYLPEKVDVEVSNHLFCKVSNMQHIGHQEVNCSYLAAGYQLDCLNMIHVHVFNYTEFIPLVITSNSLYLF